MSPQNFKFKSSLHNIHLDQSSLGNQQPEDEGKCNLNLISFYFKRWIILIPKGKFCVGKLLPQLGVILLVEGQVFLLQS